MYMFYVYAYTNFSKSVCMQEQSTGKPVPKTLNALRFVSKITWAATEHTARQTQSARTTLVYTTVVHLDARAPPQSATGTEFVHAAAAKHVAAKRDRDLTTSDSNYELDHAIVIDRHSVCPITLLSHNDSRTSFSLMILKLVSIYI